MIIKQQSQP